MIGTTVLLEFELENNDIEPIIDLLDSPPRSSPKQVKVSGKLVKVKKLPIKVEKLLVKSEKVPSYFQKPPLAKATMLQSQVASIEKLCNSYANSTIKCDALVDVKLQENAEK